jgi:hypothetical protein
MDLREMVWEDVDWEVSCEHATETPVSVKGEEFVE